MRENYTPTAHGMIATWGIFTVVIWPFFLAIALLKFALSSKESAIFTFFVGGFLYLTMAGCTSPSQLSKAEAEELEACTVGKLADKISRPPNAEIKAAARECIDELGIDRELAYATDFDKVLERERDD